MKVIVTGGTGFLGLRLARAILERGTLYGASAAPESINKMIQRNTKIGSIIEDSTDPEVN